LASCPCWQSRAIVNRQAQRFEAIAARRPARGALACAYHADVERNTRTDRATAVVAAAAHEFNDELTVILNAVAESLEALPPTHPLYHGLIEAQCAAHRCAQRAEGMLCFSARRGLRPAPSCAEALLWP
jgi:hypothetical protein